MAGAHLSKYSVALYGFGVFAMDRSCTLKCQPFKLPQTSKTGALNENISFPKIYSQQSELE